MKLLEMINSLDELRIDNKHGWGAVPDNQNVDYKGLRVSIKPSMFLRLAHKLDKAFSAGDIERHIRSDGAIGAPFLMVAIPHDWFEGNMTMPAEIYGHEGRNRMTAALRVEGDEPVETHLFFGSGLRNRDLNSEIVLRLNQNIISQDGTIVNGPWFSNGKNLNEMARYQLKDLLDDVEQDFIRSYLLRAIETVENYGARVDKTPKLKLLFDKNMHLVADYILRELHDNVADVTFIRDMRNRLNLIGMKLPDAKLTTYLRRYKIPIDARLHDMLAYDPIEAILFQIELAHWGLMVKDVISSLDKDAMIKNMLQMMKNDRTKHVSQVIELLKRNGYDWPEFKAFEKSISSATTLKEDDDVHDAEDIAKVSKAVAKAFKEGLPYDAIETLHYENLRVDDSPAIKALFDANMGRIAKWIANEVATADIGDLDAVMGTLDSQLDDIGISMPNATISNALQDSYTRIERNIVRQAMDSLSDAIIAIQALNNWGLGIELDDVIDVEDSKADIIRAMLVDIKKRRSSKAMNTLLMLREINVDWPELDAIEKSLRASNIVKEADENDEKEQLRRVKSDWKAIKDIPNPSEKVQLISVRNDTRSLRFIENPTDKVRKMVLMWDPKAITYLRNPTEDDQLTAVKYFSTAIKHIKNPSEKIQIAAVRYSNIAIHNIDNPNEKVQIAAVRKDGLALFYIKNPSPALWKDKASKKSVMVLLLSSIKEDPSDVDGMINNIKNLKNIGCPWPELDVIEKSLKASTRKIKR